MAGEPGNPGLSHYDGGGNGNYVTPPAGWLEDYWMGRYYGMIDAPTTEDPALLTILPSRAKLLGAKAYAGPPRP